MDDELQGVMLDWQVSDLHSPQTYDRMTETVHRFAARLAAQGVATFIEVTHQQAASFVLAPTSGGCPPQVHTQHAGRTAVRTLYRTLRHLNFADGDPTLDLGLPSCGLRVARPLTDEEVTLSRASAQAMPGRRGGRSSSPAPGHSLPPTTHRSGTPPPSTPSATPAHASASSPAHATATCAATTSRRRSWQAALRTATPASSR